LSELIMRDATEADLPAVIEMLVDDDRGRLREDSSLPLDPGYLAAFDAITRDPNQQLIVAERDGALVGTLQLSFLPGLSYKGAWRGQIEAVRITSDLRGQGLGAQMIEWAVEHCRARGCRIAQLTSNGERLRAHAFYERLGFVGSHVGMKRELSHQGE
jgi:GNAT superfamily N-acetyltransferase